MKRKSALMVALLMLPFFAEPSAAQYGNTPPLHVSGNQLKDPHGNTVVLHGVMDTPSPYFNSYRWGNECSTSTVSACRTYFRKLFTAMTDTAQGAWANLFRLHLDPCWTNDPNKTSDGKESGEADISRFSETRLKTFLRTLYFQIAKDAIGKGMYVILRPPGVFPSKVQVGDYYNDYLTKVWDIVTQNDSIKKYSGQISIELGNEPVTVLDANGNENVNALHDFFQPIVDKIRENGYTGIIWVPGSGWQSNFKNYAVNPITGYNIGYAVHNYVGWYGADDSVNPKDSLTYIKKFKESVPVLDTNPIVITEVDWSPYKEGSGHYNEHNEWVESNYGTWATGSTSKWGTVYKSILDHYGNISMTLSGTGCYIDIDTYINSKKVVPAFDGLEEACGAATFEWYKEYAQVNYPRPDFTALWSADNTNGTFTNPIINADFPDPDIIRVGDTYYLATTTMFYFPGVTILKSKDLVNWEYCCNPLKKINDADRYRLIGSNAYSKGQWAPSLNYHDGKFYINFIAFGDDSGDAGGDFLLSATDPEGAWEMTQLKGFYYDSGFLFDDGENGDGYIYVASGIGDITVSKLNSNFEELSSKKVISVGNGCEGSHFYHIGDYYYIYATYGGTEGSQTIFRSKDPMGPYEEHDGRIFANQHIHQGGLVETQTGEWWTILFKDAGTIGRIPYLEPVVWKDDWPILGNDGIDVSKDGKAYKKPNVGAVYPRTFLPTSDTFTNYELGMQWEWNHYADDSAWSLLANPGHLRLNTATVTNNFKEARNTLTQRILGFNKEGTASDSYYDSYGTIKMDLSGMTEGDIAGLCIFQEPYAYIGVKMEDGTKKIVSYNSSTGITETGETLTEDIIYLRAIANFGTAQARFYYSTDNANFTNFGSELNMKYDLAIFVGNRFALFNYATKALGGHVDIDWFSTEKIFSEERYYGPGVLKTYTTEDLTLTELKTGKSEYTLAPGSNKTLDITATYLSGLTENVAASCAYKVSKPSVATVVSGKIVSYMDGETDITATYTDINGISLSVDFTVKVTTFPLTADGINPSIYGTGSFKESTGALTTSQYGFGGWQYANSVDLSSARYLVVQLRTSPTCNPSFRLFDENNYWSTPYMYDVGSRRSFKIDLQDMTKSDGTLCDPSHIYIAGFWTTGGTIYVKDVFLSNDGSTPVGIEEIEESAWICNTQVLSTEYYNLDGTLMVTPRKGINIVRQTLRNGSTKCFKLMVR